MCGKNRCSLQQNEFDHKNLSQTNPRQQIALQSRPSILDCNRLPTRREPPELCGRLQPPHSQQQQQKWQPCWAVDFRLGASLPVQHLHAT